MDINKLVQDVVNSALEGELKRLNDNLQVIKDVVKQNNQDMELLTVKEAKDVLGVGLSCMYKLIEKGEVRALDLNGFKIPRYELKDFVQRNLGKKIDLEDEVRIS